MEEVFDKIKERAYKAKDGAVKLTQTVIDKTNTVVAQQKLKFAISKTEDKIKEVYTQIGKELYASYAEGLDEYPDIQPLCEKLDDLHKEAENLREQLSELAETVRCPGCGAYNHADDSYCSKCGNKLYDDEAGENYSAPDDEEDVVNIITPEPEDED